MYSLRYLQVNLGKKMFCYHLVKLVTVVHSALKNIDKYLIT